MAKENLKKDSSGVEKFGSKPRTPPKQSNSDKQPSTDKSVKKEKE